jgi:hypothetical protein
MVCIKYPGECHNEPCWCTDIMSYTFLMIEGHILISIWSSTLPCWSPMQVPDNGGPYMVSQVNLVVQMVHLDISDHFKTCRWYTLWCLINLTESCLTIASRASDYKRWNRNQQRFGQKVFLHQIHLVKPVRIVCVDYSDLVKSEKTYSKVKMTMIRLPHTISGWCETTWHHTIRISSTSLVILSERGGRWGNDENEDEVVLYTVTSIPLDPNSLHRILIVSTNPNEKILSRFQVYCLA